jgi:hypothetical protein
MVKTKDWKRWIYAAAAEGSSVPAASANAAKKIIILASNLE